MFGQKKINLLPIEYKNKMLNRYIIISISAVITIFVVLIVGMLINIGFLSMNINNLNKQNTEYNSIKIEIEGMEKQITENQSFINEQSKDFFDFYYFMEFLLSCKPKGLTIISVDSMDRMIDIEEKNVEPNVSSDTETIQSEELQKTEMPEQEILKNVIYDKDLSGEQLVLRGLAKSTQDISAYIYKLSQAKMISNIELSGIEEQIFNQSEKVTIFEAILEVE